jgi:hypothetical protein
LKRLAYACDISMAEDAEAAAEELVLDTVSRCVLLGKKPDESLRDSEALWLMQSVGLQPGCAHRITAIRGRDYLAAERGA